MIKILQADDHPLFRDGIRYLLAQLDDNVTLLEAGTLQATLDLLGTNHDVDLILLDLAMPGMNGFTGIQTIEERNPAVPIVILSASEEPRDIQQAMALGVAGYIPKSSTSQTMIEALRHVLAGNIYQPPIAGWQEIEPATSHFTERQRDVLKLMVEGLSNKRIARKLFLSESTVKQHVSAILNILKVESRTQAVIKIKEMGNIDWFS